MESPITDCIERRRSIREYKDQAIPKETLDKLIKNIVLCPTAGNQQSYHIYCVTNKEVITKIAEEASGQLWIKTAPCVLVFCQDAERAANKYGEKGREVFGIQDATIAQSFGLFAAYELDLASCWVGGFSAQKVSELLNITNGYEPLGILTIGYPAAGPRSDRHRREVGEVVTYIN